jgi:hypothetical protein
MRLGVEQHADRPGASADPRGVLGQTFISATRGESGERWLMCRWAVVPVLVLVSTAFGQTSELYLYGGYYGGPITVVQNGQIQRQWVDVQADGWHGSYATIAVDTTVRIHGYNQENTGREYDLEGNFLGYLPIDETPLTFAWDGASDGQYNYAVADQTRQVMRFDHDWTNPTVLFTYPHTEASTFGITWDGTNNSLWITSDFPDIIENYDMSGNFLGGFARTFHTIGGLAMDPADHTLWAFPYGLGDALYQFNPETGATIQQLVIPGFDTLWDLGGEFAVPEPASLAMVAVGTLLLSRSRRRV